MNTPQHKQTVDFIGIGGQRCGTSWIYVCLYEHPEICAPIKEIHFFSRPRYEKGTEWYLDHFSGCEEGQMQGEYSTSYLYSDVAAKRIYKNFPQAKILVSLRNPVDRAFSQYCNAIKAGEIEKETSFPEYLEAEESAVEQGFYTAQLARYLDRFGRENVHVLVYEDSQEDPAAFIRSIYYYLGVDTSFQPSMLHREVNTSRTPRTVWFENIMIRTSQILRKLGLGKLVWLVKKSGAPDKVRTVNTEDDDRSMHPETRHKLEEIFAADIRELSKLIGRDLTSLWLR